MALAKSAPQTEPSPTLTAPVIGSPMAAGTAKFEWEGIPMDILRTFNVELGNIPTKDLEQLRGISEWAKEQVGPEGSIGDMLQAISKVQRQLGAPVLNQRGFTKVAEFVKMQKVIDEMRKRQDSMKQSSLIQ